MSTVSAAIGQQFAFSHGRTGVLQQSLLSRSDVDRLLGTHDQKESEQVLIELKFTKLIDQSIRDPDAILQACQQWVRTEVSSMTPEKKRDVFDILWLDEDRPLLAYLLKKKFGFTSDISLKPVVSFTAYDVAMLETLIETDEEGSLPKNLIDFVRRTLSLTYTDPRLVDVAVAQFIADTKISLAKKSGSRIILQYVRHEIDIQNIRTALRFHESERTAAASHLLTGGNIKSSLMLGSNASLAAHIRMTGLHALAEVIDRSSEDSNSIERAFNDVLAEDISVMWNIILSVEPLFAFATTALAQIRLMRAILIGKRNALSPQHIKKMLPPFLSTSHYVL